MYNEERGGSAGSKVAVVSIEFGTLAIEVGLVLNIAVVFPFPHSTNKNY
jgi:hypothetical protein